MGLLIVTLIYNYFSLLLVFFPSLSAALGNIETIKIVG